MLFWRDKKRRGNALSALVKAATRLPYIDDDRVN
jgi:hypothetical protein